MVNIKGILPSLNSIPQPAKPAEKAKVKSNGTDDDRDANGKREDQNDQPQHGPMSEDDARQIREAILALPGVKDNNLTVEIETVKEVKVAYIKDYTGKVVRRIPESSLWHFLSAKDETKQTGHLLNKAM